MFGPITFLSPPSHSRMAGEVNSQGEPRRVETSEESNWEGEQSGRSREHEHLGPVDKRERFEPKEMRVRVRDDPRRIEEAGHHRRERPVPQQQGRQEELAHSQDGKSRDESVAMHVKGVQRLQSLLNCVRPLRLRLGSRSEGPLDDDIGGQGYGNSQANVVH